MPVSVLIAEVGLLIAIQESAYAHNGRGLASPAGDRSQSLLIGSFIATLLACLLTLVTGRGGAPSLAAFGIGQGVFFLGWVGRMAAIRQLGRFFTGHVSVADDQTVIQSGLYRVIRHPGYLGAVLELAGCCVIAGSWLAWLCLLAGYLPALLYRIRIEETALVTRFGEAYRAYQVRTWRLFPFAF